MVYVLSNNTKVYQDEIQLITTKLEVLEKERKEAEEQAKKQQQLQQQ